MLQRWSGCFRAQLWASFCVDGLPFGLLAQASHLIPTASFFHTLPLSIPRLSHHDKPCPLCQASRFNLRVLNWPGQGWWARHQSILFLPRLTSTPGSLLLHTLPCQWRLCYPGATVWNWNINQLSPDVAIYIILTSLTKLDQGWYFAIKWLWTQLKLKGWTSQDPPTHTHTHTHTHYCFLWSQAQSFFLDKAGSHVWPLPC